MSDAIGYAHDHPAVLAAQEALSLGRMGWEALRDECYAWKRVRDALDDGALSNTGHRYICWQPPRTQNRSRSGTYCIRIKAPGGIYVTQQMAAPKTLAEARTDNPRLRDAIARRDDTIQAIEADLGHSLPRTARGLYEHLRMVLRAAGAPEASTKWMDRIGEKIKAAEAYAFEEWSPNSGIWTHIILRQHPNRVHLVARGVSRHEAEALAREHHTPRAQRANATKARKLRRVSAMPQYVTLSLQRAQAAGYSLQQVIDEWHRLAHADAQEAA